MLGTSASLLVAGAVGGEAGVAGGVAVGDAIAGAAALNMEVSTLVEEAEMVLP